MLPKLMRPTAPADGGAEDEGGGDGEGGGGGGWGGVCDGMSSGDGVISG